MKRLIALTLFALPFAALAATNTSGRVYSAALSEQTAELAKVVAVRPVEIKAAPSHTGTYIGTAVGGAAGYALTRHSSGPMRGLGTIVGGAAGAGAGTLLAGVHSEHPGAQIFVQRLDGNGRPMGSLTSVVQDDDQRIDLGETVLLIRSRDGLSIAPTGDARADVEVTP